MTDLVVEWNENNPNERITLSVELENLAKKNIDLIAKADVVFLSKDFAILMGWLTKEVAIHNLRKFVQKR